MFVHFFDKYTYSPEGAYHVYKLMLVDSRLGVNVTSSEAKQMADIIGPLLKQGLSPYEILQIHPEQGICEKTLYNYIENSVFHEVVGITALDLRRQTGRKIFKKKAVLYKKREDRGGLKGCTFKDHCSYMDENPDVFATQMDQCHLV